MGSAIKAQREEVEEGDVRGVCVLKQWLLMLRPFFPGSGWTSACWWEVVNEFFLLLLSLLNLIHGSFHLPLFLPTEWSEQKAGWEFGCWLKSTHRKHLKTHSAPVPNKHHSSCFPAWGYIVIAECSLLLHFHLLLHFPSHSISFQIISCGCNDIIPVCSDHPHQKQLAISTKLMRSGILKNIEFN